MEAPHSVDHQLEDEEWRCIGHHSHKRLDARPWSGIGRKVVSKDSQVGISHVPIKKGEIFVKGKDTIIKVMGTR